MGGYLELGSGELRRWISWRQRLLKRTSVPYHRCQECPEEYATEQHATWAASLRVCLQLHEEKTTSAICNLSKPLGSSSSHRPMASMVGLRAAYEVPDLCRKFGDIADVTFDPAPRTMRSSTSTTHTDADEERVGSEASPKFRDRP